MENERQIIAEEINRLKELRANRKDALQQLMGEEYTGSCQALPDRVLENVTGGLDGDYDDYLYGVYVCPKCGGAHGVKLRCINICLKPFWSTGCIDFSTELFDAHFTSSAPYLGEIISTVNGAKYTFVLVCHTWKEGTTWFV